MDCVVLRSHLRFVSDLVTIAQSFQGWLDHIFYYGRIGIAVGARMLIYTRTLGEKILCPSQSLEPARWAQLRLKIQVFLIGLDRQMPENINRKFSFSNLKSLLESNETLLQNIRCYA